MKERGGFSIFGALAGTRRRGPAGPGDRPEAKKLSGASLEEAYRELLLQNEVLVDSNQRLHERLAQTEAGLVESPAARQLIRAQRNALADRSHKLREIAYQHKLLQRKHGKLGEENRRLLEKIERQDAEMQPLKRELEAKREEIAELKRRLTQTRNELVVITDRYYQLEAQMAPADRSDIVVNGKF